MTRLLSLCLLLLSASLAHAAEPGAPLDVRGADGERIPTQVLEPEGGAANPPVAILLHGLTRKKEDWLSDAAPTHGGVLKDALLRAGYRVYLMDARRHGERATPEAKPGALAKQAHRGEPGPYIAMIADTIKDAHALLTAVLAKGKPPRVLVAGYSMGAQVGLVLAAREPRVTHLVTMVPPHIEPTMEEIAPSRHMSRIHQDWLLLTANQDDFAPVAESRALFDAAPSRRKVHKTFDSGHALPREYLDEVSRWLQADRRAPAGGKRP
ncbi:MULTISPECIES: alpha/beta hydrolase [unclassified Myxococcus]|uniref:alpha/beta hydrolase n=1 Tax=unclassified Myxococcus TaxID=2648731 RepID=UPI00157B9378|nr:MULTISPECIES: alpha/beta fold hydrolase [unclassified Myxococcus]NTX04579.1 alpha/beta fold hydrolase [Myxococcus sp. CA040A]NTX17145.1 alpha/beta fold hydrolase [Myxococcus sp. CA056]NTX35932.1 alpha/beta fold hydrolase [Myxococcus sp. CA033]